MNKCAQYDPLCNCPACEADRAEAKAAFGNWELLLDQSKPGFYASQLQRVSKP